MGSTAGLDILHQSIYTVRLLDSKTEVLGRPAIHCYVYYTLYVLYMSELSYSLIFLKMGIKM